jgi:predicted amidohydrolase YtcJ
MIMPRTPSGLAGLLLSLGLCGAVAGADGADLNLHHGQVVMVDREFSVRQSQADEGDRLLRLGTDEKVLETGVPGTRVIDLEGKMVLPGLIDSHTHPIAACMTEFAHPIPEMETVWDVLDSVRSRAGALGPGKWVAITRRADGYEGRLHPEKALCREQAIRFYTINNARLLFLEDRIGSLEAGKQADFVVLDRNLPTCPEDEIRGDRALATYLDGERVFERRD